MNKVSVALALLAVLVIAALCAENRDLSGNQKATLKLLADESAAHRFTLDTIKARNAEREVGDQKHADSLRRVIARTYKALGADRLIPKFGSLSPEHKIDTVRLPYETYVYVTDTLLPACTLCASRLDSAVLAARAEREAATLLIQSKDRELNWWVTHDKPHHSLRTKLRERIGLTVGYGATSAGGQVYVGPQVGVSIRLIP